MTDRETGILLSAALIAQWTFQPVATVRTWAKRGKLLPVACDVRTRAHLYDAGHISEDMFRNTPSVAA
jgi:hypothetical protein